jgi:hypothetical protein
MRLILTAAALALSLGGCASPGQQEIAALQSFTLADIDAAYRWAIWNDDKPAMQCLPTLRAAVIHLQSDTAAGVQYGAITWGQIAGDLANPNGRVRADCAALAAERKAQANAFLGQVATLVAGL